MAVKKITQIDRYIGLSTDTKPTSAPPGSTFLEADTTKLFVWDGSNWRDQSGTT